VRGNLTHGALVSPDVAALRGAIEAAETAYAVALAECQRQADEFGYDVMLTRDTAGRYLLLDALSQIVAARAVLASVPQ
jgi:hypothetical protein